MRPSSKVNTISSDGVHKDPQIDLYILALADVDERLSATVLNATEIDRARRFHRVADQQRSTKSRTALRTILAGKIGCRPDALSFREEEGQKPTLKEPWSERVPNLHFNQSHSGERIAIAVSESPVGVDIEQLKPLDDWSDISSRFFHPTEIAHIESTSPERQLRLFFDLWTQKESYVKGIGVGLHLDTRHFAVNPKGGPVRPVLGVGPDGEGWKTMLVDGESDYSTAVATRAETCSIRRFTSI